MNDLYYVINVPYECANQITFGMPVVPNGRGYEPYINPEGIVLPLAHNEVDLYDPLEHDKNRYYFTDVDIDLIPYGNCQGYDYTKLNANFFSFHYIADRCFAKVVIECVPEHLEYMENVAAENIDRFKEFKDFMRASLLRYLLKSPTLVTTFSFTKFNINRLT